MWHIFYLKKSLLVYLLWIFDSNCRTWNSTTSSAGESSILWASLHFFKHFLNIFQHIFNILPNYSNSHEKTMKFDAPHLVSNIHEARAKEHLTHLERIPNAFSLWRLQLWLSLASIFWPTMVAELVLRDIFLVVLIKSNRISEYDTNFCDFL